MSAHNDDSAEALELEQAAEWRLRQVDANPNDERSAMAARQLQKLADDVRQLRDSPAYAEYQAICNWLGESGEIADFSIYAHDFRAKLGFGTWAEDGEAYLRALVQLARGTSGH